MIRLFSELYQYRALVFALTARTVAGRYRGSALGALWSLLNPLFLMLIYTLVFKYYIRFNAVENYSLFMFCGLVPWIWFNTALIEGAASIAGSGHLITKSMFPPQVLPAVAVLSNSVHFAVSMVVLAVFMLISGVPFTFALIALPFLILMQMFISYGLGLMLAALNVKFRDVQHLLGNFLSLLFFLTPIVYPIQNIPERFRFTYELNPIALLVSSYHEVILYGRWPSLWQSSELVLVAFGLLALGTYVFNRYREQFAENL